MIVIPNMEIPKDCIDCPLKPLDKFGYPYCIILKRYTIGEKYADCPLIEIDESEMEYLYKTFGLEKDENLTEGAKELKRAILMGYLYAKKDVVRCKECIHRIEDPDFQSGHFCLKRRGNGGLFCEDNDSCSYGEREFNEKCR